MDIQMPEMNGYDVTKIIRQQELLHPHYRYNCLSL